MPTANALQIYGKIANPIAEAKSIARAVASMIPGTSIDQGEAIALVCMIEGIAPLDFARRYWWIPGKGASMRSDAMLAEFAMNYGGKYERIERSPQRAAIKLTTANGKVYECELTRRNLMLSRWPWRGKDDKAAGVLGWRAANAKVYELIAAGHTDDEIFATMLPHFKDNYGTETDWQNMLWARLVSESIRSICSEINAGVYTPEEISDVAEGVYTIDAPPKEPRETAADLLKQAAATVVVESNGSGIAAHAEPAPAPTVVIEAAPFATDDGEVVDAEFTVTPDEPANEIVAGTVTRSQLDKLQQLRIDVGLSNEDWEAGLARRGVKAAHSLGREQAQEMIDRLESRKAQLAAVPN